MSVLHLAIDVLREALARRVFLAIFAAIGLGLMVMIAALDLEVVDGALAASRLFGQAMTSDIRPVDVVLRPVFSAIGYAVFHLGLIVGIVATCDIAPTLLSPGRVELLLSLPVSRTALVIGTYVGVLLVAAISATASVAGVTLVLVAKARFVTIAPLAGAIGATIAFMPIYAVMLLAAALARSAALAAGAGFALYFASLLTSDRVRFLGWLRAGFVREIASVIVQPVPRLEALADLSASAASGAPIAGEPAAAVVVAAASFAAFALCLAAWVVSRRDY